MGRLACLLGIIPLLVGCTEPLETGGGSLVTLDRVSLHLNLGDSAGAGYNASGNNAPQGRGYARLLYDNHAAYPDYADANIVARSSAAEFVDRAKSGSTSADVVYQIFALPEVADGDVVVTIYVGGNDFNDDLATMLVPEQTQLAIDNWIDNMMTTIAQLRDAYARPEQGVRLALVMATIHEPTDATFAIPAHFDEGFCKALQQLQALGEETKMTVWDNYRAFNVAIRGFASQQGALLIDTEPLFVGHGLNAPQDEQWIDKDCAHMTNAGHHQLRRVAWSLLTGEE